MEDSFTSQATRPSSRRGLRLAVISLTLGTGGGAQRSTCSGATGKALRNGPLAAEIEALTVVPFALKG